MPKPPQGFDWDDRKAAYNLRKHGVSFAEAAKFDFETALKTEDLRADYGEERFLALGKIGRTLHALVYTRRPEGPIRVISLRKATAEERRLYNETRAY
jgi:hypothetical protein